MRRRTPRQTGETPALVDEGIRLLCLAMIEGAEKDLTQRGWHTWPNGPHPATEWQWLSSDTLRPGSFAWACAVVGFDPSYIRRGILTRVRKQQATPRPGAHRQRIGLSPSVR